MEECGPNVLKMIFQMDNIKIYMSRPSFVEILAETEICFNDKEIVTGNTGYQAWWSREYEVHVIRSSLSVPSLRTLTDVLFPSLLI